MGLAADNEPVRHWIADFLITHVAVVITGNIEVGIRFVESLGHRIGLQKNGQSSTQPLHDRVYPSVFFSGVGFIADGRRGHLHDGLDADRDDGVDTVGDIAGVVEGTDPFGQD